MNEPKQTEQKRSGFDAWWFDVGSGFPPLQCEDAEAHARRVSRMAWEAALLVGAMDVLSAQVLPRLKP